MDLKEKIVVVLGAGGGIGSAVVKELEKSGATVIPLERNDVDLTDLDQVEKVSTELSKKYPNIDAFINATGIGVYQGLPDLNKDDWKKSLNINLSGPLFFIKGILPSLNKNDSVVINIGSGLGKKPYYTERIPYIVSKFGLRGMSLALSRDFEGKFPNFCLVTLGSVMTGFGPGGVDKRKDLEKKGKLYFTPEWVAERIVYVIKDTKRQSEYTFYPKDYIKGAVSG
jgi:NADP-dependent 3-hydroxy acid dehydrogenase YdfG